MLSCKRCFPFLVGLLILAPVLAVAQWSSNPALDLIVADGATEQCVPHVAPTSDGGCYVGWYDNLSLGVFHVRLQRLSPSGAELWGHGGILVSDHPTDTWVMDWDLIADSRDNAVLVFNDLRDGEINVQSYKIDPEGNFLWGPDGISLTANSKRPAFPRLAQATDGDFVVVWPEGDVTNKIMMQRLSPSGELRYDAGGIEIVWKSGKYPFGPDLIPTPDNGVIVAWIPNSELDKDRHLSARKFGPDGTGDWKDAVKVLDEGHIPIGVYFDLQPDGQGGALLTWTYESELYFSVRAQHLTAAGTEMWPHNGLVVYENSLNQHIYPCLAYDSATEETYIFSRAQALNQRSWGLDGQNLAADGTRQWGESGRELLPIDYSWVSIPLCSLVPAGGAMVFYLTHAPDCEGQERVDCLRVGTEGKFTWPQEIVTMASNLSDKLFMSAYMSSDGSARTVWQDRRMDYGDILAKSINLDGSLGLGASPVSPAPAGRGVEVNIFPNPFNPQAVISLTLERAQRVTVDVCDLRGCRLAQLADRGFAAGPNQIIWSGTDASGRPLASGSYVVQMLGEDFTHRQTITLVR